MNTAQASYVPRSSQYLKVTTKFQIPLALSYSNNIKGYRRWDVEATHFRQTLKMN